MGAGKFKPLRHHIRGIAARWPATAERIAVQPFKAGEKQRQTRPPALWGVIFRR
jgi:hypothetical protein